MKDQSINQRREALGWSMAELARQAQVPSQRVRRACEGADITADEHLRIESALRKQESQRNARPVFEASPGHLHPTLKDHALHATGAEHEHVAYGESAVLEESPET
jgi:ribosome-binding protein aMBF1 (putative translation factor)